MRWGDAPSAPFEPAELTLKFSFPRSAGTGDDVRRLVVHLEHLAEAAALLRAGGVVRQRMALVAADHLAEVLLQDHMEVIFVATEEEGPLTPRRYDRVQRQQLRSNFSARIELAAAPPVGFSRSEPLLDERDTSVFRVAHGYRNALYHGDRHNPALGRPLAVEYLQAVGRALVRSWSPGLSCGGYGARDPRLQAFRRLGAPSVSSFFAPRLVAEECVRNLVGQFRVQRVALRRQLIKDIEDRARGVQATLDRLGQLGLTRDAQRQSLNAILLWAAYRADPALVRLQDENDAIVRGSHLERDGHIAARVGAYAANEAAMQSRRDALSQAFRPPVTITTAAAIARAARKLSSVSHTAHLLEGYRQVDERLGLLEQAVTRVEIELDRMIEYESDLARGK